MQRSSKVLWLQFRLQRRAKRAENRAAYDFIIAAGQLVKIDNTDVLM